MEERRSRLSSMAWKRLQPYSCDRLIPQNSMSSNFCHVLNKVRLIIKIFIDNGRITKHAHKRTGFTKLSIGFACEKSVKGLVNRDTKFFC